MIYDRYDLVWVTASQVRQHITNLAVNHNVQNKSWFAYKITASSSRLNYSYTTHMWSVLDLFSFHVTTHFTLENTEKLIRKKNIQNGSNKSDSTMTPNQMKTAVRAVSQNIMNTKYNQISVNTKCAYVKQFYYRVTEFVWTTFISTAEKHARCSCPSASDMHCMITVSHPEQYNHKPFWSPVLTSLLNILIFLPYKLEFDTQVLLDTTLRKMVNS